MKHLFSHSVYQGVDLFGEDPRSTLEGLRCDGLELLTGFDPIPAEYIPHTSSVHLPYAPDWLAAWEDRPYQMDDPTALYLMYGKSREQLVENIRKSIIMAEPLKPAHGVMHACNADLPYVRKHSSVHTDEYVIRAFCDMMNTVVEDLDGGEPPFRINFENLWWPGMRLLDPHDFTLMRELLEFDNWGICLDTGHMMNCLPGIYTEQDGIRAVLEIVSRYPDDLIDRISSVHFHFSASSKYRDTFEEEDLTGSAQEFYWKSYRHVSSIDQHRAYSDPACAEIVDILEPDLLVYELPGKVNGPLNDFRQQRALFPRSGSPCHYPFI